MCEIAMLQTSRFKAGDLWRISKRIYTRMSHGLGVVFVNDQNPGFDYTIYREAEPDLETADGLYGFIDEHINDNEFIIIHGRLATSGGVTEQGVHPLPIECDQCSLDHIIHNGIYIRNHRFIHQAQDDLREAGHELTTEIDTELIAHEFGAVPGSIEEAHDILGQSWKLQSQSGFILLGERRLFLYGNAYQLTEDFEMVHRHRDFAPNDADHDYNMVLIKSESDRPEETREITEVGA